MATLQDADAPIALRKPKRRSSVLSSPVKPRTVSDSVMQAKTPGTRRSKRVRFSDPGLFSPSAATSLTPAFRRSSLATPKQRRPATPGRPAIEGAVQFTPFTQTLDERCQRRIRRHRLSEETNKYDEEKRCRAALEKQLKEKDAELQELRAQIEAAKTAPEQPFQSEPPPSSQQRYDEVEAELEALRNSFALTQDESIPEAFPPASWDHVPLMPGPQSDGGDTIPMFDDDEPESFPHSHGQPAANLRTEAVSMELELEAARQAKSSFLGSFREQPANPSFDFDFRDSPARKRPVQIDEATSVTSSLCPSTVALRDTPRPLYLEVRKQLNEVTSRAEEAELALTALDIEVSALGFGEPTDDTMAMIGVISNHFRSARVELERLVPGETTSGFEPPQILPEILTKMRLLANKLQSREHDLKAAKDQHHNLKNNFEKAIVAAEKANAQIKQLEQMIDSNAEDSLHIRMRSQQLERDLSEKEDDVASLSNALNKYRNDITRLETLVDNLQTENETNAEKAEIFEARAASETTGRRAAEVSAVQRLARINELENQLAESRRRVTELEARLTALDNGDALPSGSQQQRDEVASLNSRITNLANALATANAEVERLKINKNKLEERVRSEAEQGAKAVETLQEQLIRTVMKGNEARKRYVNGTKVRIANWELDDEREAASSDGITMVDDSEQTPCAESRRSSLVKFAEYAEVETFERDLPHESGDEAGGESSGSESLPGSVTIQRGRGKFRKTPRLVTFDQAKRSGLGIDHQGEPSKRGKRKYDSGIGMDSDFEIYDEERDSAVKGSGEVRNGMMTPEMSSDGDSELDRETDMVDV